MTFKVKFSDEITAASEEEAYGILLRYLYDCVSYDDVTAFDFKKASPRKNGVGPIALSQTMSELYPNTHQAGSTATAHNKPGWPGEEFMLSTIKPEKLERVFQIFHDIKKTLTYDKHTGQWAWCDRDEPEYPQGYFSTAYEAMLDAVEPYLD